MVVMAALNYCFFVGDGVVLVDGFLVIAPVGLLVEDLMVVMREDSMVGGWMAVMVVVLVGYCCWMKVAGVGVGYLSLARVVY